MNGNMHYEPSHRKLPPRQARWPHATPQEGWPAYLPGDGNWNDDWNGDRDRELQGADRRGWAAAGDRGQPAYEHSGDGPEDRGYRGYRQAGAAADALAGAAHGYGALDQYRAPDQYGAPGGYGAADAYGAADGNRAPGGYGAADGYGAPDQYAASGGYGAANGNGAAGGYGDAGYGHAWPGTGYSGGRAEMAGEYAGGGTGHPWNNNGHDRHGGAGPGYSDAWDGSGEARNGNGSTRDGYAGTWNGYAETPDGYADTWNGNGNTWDGYADTRNGNGSVRDGYADTRNGNGSVRDGYADTWNGYGGHDGYGGTWDSFPGSASSGDQLDRGEYAEPRPSGPLLVAPDTIGEPGWLRDESKTPGRPRDRSELIIGAVTGFLAAAVAIGFGTLAAAFVRPQASPVIAVGGAFIDRTPSALKNFAVAHFGENDKTVLLLGMYVTIALIAVAVGCLARRRGVAIGVAGIAAFGLFGAFVAITRPDSHLTDVIPSVIGGIAGVIALLWLDRRAAPLSPLQPAQGGRRRAR